MISIKRFFNLNIYVSQLDKFLHDYDKTHSSLSLSQRQEKQKYAEIFHLRDHSSRKNEPAPTLWDRF
jgi:hypothetical protein